MVLPDIGDDDLHASAKKRRRHAESKAASAPSDKRDFLLHLLHRRLRRLPIAPSYLRSVFQFAICMALILPNSEEFVSNTTKFGRVCAKQRTKREAPLLFALLKLRP